VPASASAALKQSLLAPSGKYYGLTIDGVPGSTAKLDALNAAIGKTPSVLQFFTNWNQTADAKSAGYSGVFAAANVVKAWSRGALPVVTWQSQDSGFLPGSGKSRTDQPDYQLSKITAGAYDDYIRDFAVSIVKTNLPVVIRMDQEMNGNFYPWSEGLNGNETGDFAAMWRHVWTIFQNVGANDSVIWEWAPNRVDKLGAAANKLSTLAGLYPGDQYVDWLALDAYWRTSTTATDWATTFSKSLGLLEQVSSSKKIFLSEVGALQSENGTDLTAKKTAWISNMIDGVLADPRIVGFAYFDNAAQQTSNGVVTTNDWRLEAAPTVVNAFAGLIAPSTFVGGLPIDGASGAK
jgi:mannan endo-1,4-beta-mannosidase